MDLNKLFWLLESENNLLTEVFSPVAIELKVKYTGHILTSRFYELYKNQIFFYHILQQQLH